MKKKVYLILVSFLALTATAQTTGFSYSAKLPEGTRSINEVENDVANILSKNETIHAIVFDGSYKKVKLLSNKISINSAVVVNDGILFKTSRNTFNIEMAKSPDYFFSVYDLSYQRESGKHVAVYTTRIHFDNEVEVDFYSLDKELMCRLVDNLFFIKTYFTNEFNTKELTRFSSVIATNKDISPTPALMEEQRKYIVQANTFAKEKVYYQAFNSFKKALQVSETGSPDIYYNMALLYGEISKYNDAIMNMKKYLLLVPGSSDARSCQDKIYEWEGKLGR